MGTIDPVLAAGPPIPQDTVRPMVIPRRHLVLRHGAAHMVDLVSGDTRPWENGPPVVLPLASSQFDASDIAWMQVQVARDRREPSRDTPLFEIALGGTTISVRSSAAGSLIIDDGSTTAIGPLGESPDIVIRLTFRRERAGESWLHVTARNAETPTTIALDSGQLTSMIGRLVVGGTIDEQRVTRKRTSPVHIHVAPTPGPAGQVRHAAQRARRVAGIVRDRLS